MRGLLAVHTIALDKATAMVAPAGLTALSTTPARGAILFAGLERARGPELWIAVLVRPSTRPRLLPGLRGRLAVLTPDQAPLLLWRRYPESETSGAGGVTVEEDHGDTRFEARADGALVARLRGRAASGRSPRWRSRRVVTQLSGEGAQTLERELAIAGRGRARWRTGALLELGDHADARSLKSHRLSLRPLLTRYLEDLELSSLSG